MDEGKRKELLKKFDRFAGGRSLTAIYECEHLNAYEQSILLYLGHTAGFKTDGYVEFKPHKLETIARKIRASEQTARRTIKSLVDRGYLSRVRRIGSVGLELTPEYAMTYKIFDEYQEKWLDRQVEKLEKAELEGLPHSNPRGDSQEPQGFPTGTPGFPTGTPIILPLNSSPSLSSHPSSSSSKTPSAKSSPPPPKAGGSRKITRKSLIGALSAIYVRTVRKETIEDAVDEMLAHFEPSEICRVIETVRLSLSRERQWSLREKDYWLSFLNPSEEEEAQEASAPDRSDPALYTTGYDLEGLPH